MKFITILSHVLTLSLFAVFGFFIIFFFKNIIEKADQKKTLSSSKVEIENCLVNISEEMPRFPGCEDIKDRNERRVCSQQKMLKYIYSEIKIPLTARESAIEGTVVVVRFYVDKQGNIKAPEILKDIGGGFGEEVLRVVETMNHLPEKWIPGRQHGKAVKVYFNLPIRIRLE